MEQSNLDQKPDGPIPAAASCWCLKSDAPANAGARPQVLLSASHRLFEGDSYLDFSVSNIRQSGDVPYFLYFHFLSFDVCSLLPQCIRGTRAGTLMGPFQILEHFPSNICARTEAAGRARPPEESRCRTCFWSCTIWSLSQQKSQVFCFIPDLLQVEKRNFNHCRRRRRETIGSD